MIGSYIRHKEPAHVSLLQNLPFPSVDDINYCVNHPSRGSSGPSGMPARLYKATQSIAIPLLYLVLITICSGILAPTWFLLSRLVCIDKKAPSWRPDLGLCLMHSEARPISVTNNDYRVVFRAIS